MNEAELYNLAYTTYPGKSQVDEAVNDEAGEVECLGKRTAEERNQAGFDPLRNTKLINLCDDDEHVDKKPKPEIVIVIDDDDSEDDEDPFDDMRMAR